MNKPHSQRCFKDTINNDLFDFVSLKRKKEVNYLKNIVIDSLMGSGKTSMMIQYMDQYPDQNFLFVTPFLNEVDRIKSSCKNPFFDPINHGCGKRESLKQLLSQGRNIVTTHALFLETDPETEDLIRTGGYVMVLDETLDVISPYNDTYTDKPMRKKDIAFLLDQGLISIDEYGAVTWLKYASYDDYVFEHVEFLAKAGNLICIDKSLFLCQFPPRIFTLFDETFILTYMFGGSFLKSYFDYYGIEYENRSVYRNDEGYYIGAYRDDIASRKQIKDLIHIVDDAKLNGIGKKQNALSYGWYQRSSSNAMTEIRKNINTLLKRRLGGVKSNRIMWCSFKDYQDAISRGGYKNIRQITSKEGRALSDRDLAKLSCFVPCGTRATNDFAERDVLMYLVNRYPNPEIVKFFGKRGIRFDKDQFALSELLQWIWRSAIRNGEHITVYIPSRRMRQLLIDWLDAAEK